MASCQQDSIGIGWIILLVLLYITFNPVPVPLAMSAETVI